MAIHSDTGGVLDRTSGIAPIFADPPAFSNGGVPCRYILASSDAQEG